MTPAPLPQRLRPAPREESRPKVNTPSLVRGSRTTTPTAEPNSLQCVLYGLAFTRRNPPHPLGSFKHIEQPLNARPSRHTFPQSKLPPRSPRASEPWEPPGGAGSGRPSGSGGVAFLCTPVRQGLTSLGAGRVASFGGLSPQSGRHSRVPPRGTYRVSGRAGGPENKNRPLLGRSNPCLLRRSNMARKETPSERPLPLPEPTELDRARMKRALLRVHTASDNTTAPDSDHPGGMFSVVRSIEQTLASMREEFAEMRGAVELVADAFDRLSVRERVASRSSERTTTLTRTQSAETLQVSLNTFDKHYRPRLSNVGVRGKPLFGRAAVEALASGAASDSVKVPRPVARGKNSVDKQLASDPAAQDILKLIQQKRKGG